MIITLILVTVGTLADAQSRRRPSEGPEFGDKVWFGVNLNDLRFGNNTFSFGLTPMAAVEVAPDFSLGAMLKFDYYFEKYRFFSGGGIKFESLDFGPAVFARADILEQFFAQVEYERANLERPQVDNAGNWIVDQSTNKVLTQRYQQNYVYVGAGYQSGRGNLKTTISIHYNILDDFDSVRFPWDYRVGVRWYLR